MECDITAECPLFPPSAQTTDALSVLSRPSPSAEVRCPKTDQVGATEPFCHYGLNLAQQRRTADPADYRDAFQMTKMMIDRDPAYDPEEHLLATRRGTPLLATDVERGR